MSKPIFSYNKKCDDTQGGVKEFYISPFIKYTRSQLDFTDVNLLSFPMTAFYRYQCEGTYTQKSDYEGGSSYVNQSMSLRIPKAYTTINKMDFLKQDFRVIVQTHNDYFLMFGMLNGLEGVIDNSSGGNRSDFNGFNILFSGKETNTALKMDNLDDLIIITQETDEFLNYDLNTDI